MPTGVPDRPWGPLGYDTDADIDSDGAINVLDMSMINVHWAGPPKGSLSQD